MSHVEFCLGAGTSARVVKIMDGLKVVLPGFNVTDPANGDSFPKPVGSPNVGRPLSADRPATEKTMR
jgi:hypothetical protein